VVGQTVIFRKLPSEIIGVVPDFAIDAAHHVIPPTIYYMMPPRGIAEEGLLSLKLRPDADEQATFKAIDTLWKDVGEPRPVSRYAMKGFLENLNADVIAQAQTFTAFSVLAVFIAAIGLFGLSAFTAERRTKEIGVRKTMGATRRDILRLLLLQFTRPVLWANLIAWPVAYFFMRRWLQGFAYHIDLAPWMFLGASALALIIALATVIGHALLVARAQPVTALRYE
jgi:putative ABC transport system permease protein